MFCVVCRKREIFCNFAQTSFVLLYFFLFHVAIFLMQPWALHCINCLVNKVCHKIIMIHLSNENIGIQKQILTCLICRFIKYFCILNPFAYWLNWLELFFNKKSCLIHGIKTCSQNIAHVIDQTMFMIPLYNLKLGSRFFLASWEIHK